MPLTVAPALSDPALAAPAARFLVIGLSALVAGIVNSIAGGGTLLTFPALVAAGLPPLVANATSTVALWPAAVSSLWGYRDAVRGARRWAMRFAVPSLLGGLAGAILLLRTPSELFARLAPILVLGATFLFMAQAPVARWLRSRTADGHVEPPVPPAPYLAFQFLVAIYGGYFGAGIGILMLAALGLMGVADIHRANGLKNWGGLCTNVVAALSFAASGIVRWPEALVMAVSATLGGYLGSRAAQKVPQAWVRRAVVAVGFGSAAWLLWEGTRG